MEDKRLEARKKFLDPVIDRRKDREKFMVNLRKKKKQELFKKKRILLFNRNDDWGNNFTKSRSFDNSMDASSDLDIGKLNFNLYILYVFKLWFD